MDKTNIDSIAGTIAITVLPQENGRFVCQMSSSLSDRPQSAIFYGQNQQHAIALALEHLADMYRTAAEENQGIDALDTETPESEQVRDKRYHVIIHYEDIIEAESKFEALHNTLIGNTVVENAKSAVIKILRYCTILNYLFGNRQDACSTRDEFYCGTGILPVLDNGAKCENSN